MITNTEKINFFTVCFGEAIINNDGVNVAAKCPKCNDTSGKRKLHINLENNKAQCWVCGIKGANLYYIIRNFVSKELAKVYIEKFSIQNIFVEDNEEEIEEKITLPNTFKMLATCLKSRDPDIRDCLSYLKNRDLSLHDLWRYKIGSCVNGFGRRRIFIPSFDVNQDLNYYVSRTIDENVKPKYLNAKTKKKNIIFDELSLDFQKELIIVEGVFDMIKCGGNSVPLLGSALRPGYALFDKIVENGTRVILALDDDAIEKTHSIAKSLIDFGIQTKVCDTSGYEDIGSMSKKVICQRLNEANNYSHDRRLYYLISKINSGSIF